MIRNTINENNPKAEEAKLSIKTKPKKILNSTRCGVDDIDELNYMLTIKNIKQLELNFCHQRGLKRITETTNALGEHFYCFNFGPISDGNGWNKETEVRLSRDAKGDGSYQIFVMGLQVVAENFIKLSDIKTKDGLVNAISKVLAKAKHWWKTTL